MLLAVAALPFTYALTVNLGFPLKIYEVALAALLVTHLLDLRLALAPGTANLVRMLAWFIVAAAVLTVLRFALPAEGAATPDFAARFGPIGDAVSKILYLILGVLGFVLFSRTAYVDEPGYVRAWLLGAIITGAYSWYLFAMGLFGFEPLLLPGIDDPKYFTVAGRAFIRSGTFQEGNFLGLFLLVSVGIALHAGRKRLAALLSLTVLLTFSTVNVLGLGLLWGLVWARAHAGVTLRRKALYLVTGLVLILVIGYLLFQTGYLQSVVFGKLDTDEVGSRVRRVAFVISGLRMFADHPFLGVGISQFGYFYNFYQPLGALGVAQTVKLIPNNIYVELLSELGIIGFLMFVTFLITVYRRLRHPELTSLRLTFTTVLFALNAYPTYTVMFLWAFLGLAAGVSARIARPPAELA